MFKLFKFFKEYSSLHMSLQFCACGVEKRCFTMLQTSTAMMYLLHEVAKSEEIQDKLFAEVSTALGDCEDVNSSNIQNLSFAKNCLKEILR